MQALAPSSGEGLYWRGHRWRSFYTVEGKGGGRESSWVVGLPCRQRRRGGGGSVNGHPSPSPSPSPCSCPCSWSLESSGEKKKNMRMRMRMGSFSFIARTSASTSSCQDDAKEVDSDTSMVKVKFVLEKRCEFGEKFRVVGEDALLGTWDPEAALTMEWSEGHVWTAELEVPAGKRMEYKFVLKGGEDGEPQWQPGSNRVLDTFLVDEEQMIVTGLWDDEEESFANYQHGLLEEDESFLEGVSENGCGLVVTGISHNNTVLVPEAKIKHIDANKQIPLTDVVAIDEQVLQLDINGKPTNIEIIVDPNDTLKLEGGSSTFEAEIQHIDANKPVPSMDVVAIDEQMLQLDINAEPASIESAVDPNDTLKLEGGSSTFEAEIQHNDANKPVPSMDVLAIDEQVLQSDINAESTSIEIAVDPNDTLKLEGGSSTFEAEIQHIDANKPVSSMDVVAIDEQVLQLDINAEPTRIEIAVNPNDTLKLEGGSSTFEAEIQHIGANKPVPSMDVVAINEQVLQLDINAELTGIEIAVDPNDTLKAKENSERSDQDDFLNQDVSDNGAEESLEPRPDPSVIENDLDWGRKAFRNLFRAFGGNSWQNES